MIFSTPSLARCFRAKKKKKMKFQSEQYANEKQKQHQWCPREHVAKVISVMWTSSYWFPFFGQISCNCLGHSGTPCQTHYIPSPHASRTRRTFVPIVVRWTLCSRVMKQFVDVTDGSSDNNHR